MVDFSKIVELIRELNSCISKVKEFLDEVLGYDLEVDDGVIVTFDAEGKDCLTIYYYDDNEDCSRKALVGEQDYSTMMKITSKEELLSFLDERVIY